MCPVLKECVKGYAQGSSAKDYTRPCYIAGYAAILPKYAAREKETEKENKREQPAAQKRGDLLGKRETETETEREERKGAECAATPCAVSLLAHCCSPRKKITLLSRRRLWGGYDL